MGLFRQISQETNSQDDPGLKISSIPIVDDTRIFDDTENFNPSICNPEFATFADCYNCSFSKECDASRIMTKGQRIIYWILLAVVLIFTIGIIRMIF